MAYKWAFKINCRKASLNAYPLLYPSLGPGLVVITLSWNASIFFVRWAKLTGLSKLSLHRTRRPVGPDEDFTNDTPRTSRLLRPKCDGRNAGLSLPWDGHDRGHDAAVVLAAAVGGMSAVVAGGTAAATGEAGRAAVVIEGEGGAGNGQ